MRRLRVTTCGAAWTFVIRTGPSWWQTIAPGEGTSSRRSTTIGTKAWDAASCQLAARSEADSRAVERDTGTGFLSGRSAGGGPVHRCAFRVTMPAGPGRDIA
ncbi:hypothetical protein HS99_0035480 [Kitasatospora aureofaciens]|uniref:Uncharacterized protein n=1 Tax=Kitasatospora aureofaciens TaxID=1894 RepID=A0A1E7N1E4_KITAU|nr:hypothetical protein HS99_0035480 [Kitasatospora aureofaciens]